MANPLYTAVLVADTWFSRDVVDNTSWLFADHLLVWTVKESDLLAI